MITPCDIVHDIASATLPRKGVARLATPPCSHPACSGWLKKEASTSRLRMKQRRWFCTINFYLAYYKSNQKKKMHAAIDLRKVAKLSHAEGSSLMELNMDFGKVYKLRARDASEAKHWVSTLRRRIKHLQAMHSAMGGGPRRLWCESGGRP